ncbi:hypothetical protein [Inquilinus limosus]|uniref:Uncharacterized protein n=1 Tax=Inquilinus limosus MP06 TaxID=1398085 RepID=A0A0A0DC90_9PROT|nr:hypothetical protein [Inquilinus limosus]KGM35518.1 hypothetical protein P409_04040 [Inquilinus limosus MP06]
MPNWRNRGGGKRDPERVERAVKADRLRRDRRAMAAHEAEESERATLALGLLAEEIAGRDAGAAGQEADPIPKRRPPRDTG